MAAKKAKISARFPIAGIIISSELYDCVISHASREIPDWFSIIRKTLYSSNSSLKILIPDSWLQIYAWITTSPSVSEVLEIVYTLQWDVVH